MTEEEIHQRFQEGQVRYYGITPRMREYLQLYADGCTREQVQKALKVTRNTVYGTHRRILEILGADTMTQAVAIGLRTRMISVRCCSAAKNGPQKIAGRRCVDTAPDDGERHEFESLARSLQQPAARSPSRGVKPAALLTYGLCTSVERLY